MLSVCVLVPFQVFRGVSAMSIAQRWQFALFHDMWARAHAQLQERGPNLHAVGLARPRERRAREFEL